MEETLTIREISALVGRPPQTVQGWVNTGRLKSCGTERRKCNHGTHLRKVFRKEDALKAAAEVAKLPSSSTSRKYRESGQLSKEELDALVEHQMNNLPKWWRDESKKEQKGCNDLSAQHLRLVLARRYGCNPTSHVKRYAL